VFYSVINIKFIQIVTAEVSTHTELMRTV